MKPSTTFSRMRTNAGVSSRFGRWVRKQPNETHHEPRMCYGDLMRGERMKLRTGAASLPTPASPPSLSFSNHWVFMGTMGAALNFGTRVPGNLGGEIRT